MTGEQNRLDQVFDIFQQAFQASSVIDPDESLASENPPDVGAPLRALTINASSQPFAVLGLTLPSVSPKSSPLVAYLSRRARARKIPYLVLTNQNQTILTKTPLRDDGQLEVLRTYPPVTTITTFASTLNSHSERIAFTQLADKITSDVERLYHDGRLDMILPDADFFVDRLTHAVDVLKPAVQRALMTKLTTDIKFAKELEVWATPQGIPVDLRSPDFAEAVVRQAIYRLLGKIIFYQSLRRAVPNLPEMDVIKLDTAQVLPFLNDCFLTAHKIDYHAVFRQDVVDSLPFPAEASAELRDLIVDLNTRDFAHLPQDVVGSVFERLIPPEDRHALGQYFTKEDLVDLIIAFCVRSSENMVLDPTCGTGTFLIRAYNRKRIQFGLHDHNQQLGQLWGVDIAPFPAELATINLFRQQVDQPDNFPRILNEDFFNVHPGGTYRFPPLKADSSILIGEKPGVSSKHMIDESIPVFDAIVGNFPYINAANIEKNQKGYLKKVDHCLSQDWLRDYPYGFTFKKKTDQKQHQLAHEQGLDTTPFLDKGKSIISTYADLYVSLFWHAAAFLKPRGRMGIVTSNAWLDVNYGYALQRFFVDNFKIIAILESRCEPWFEQVAINTVVTIVERCNSQEECDAYPAHFVKIKRPLAELIPWDMHLDALNRWVGLSKIIQRIESLWEGSNDPHYPDTYEYDDFDIRLINQGALREQLAANGKTVKWGPYLRAPQVYFNLLQQASDQLVLLRDIAPPKFGSKTRINEFFHLTQQTINHWRIASEFCWPLIKSPGETDTVLINPNELSLKVFVCRETKEELLAKGRINTLRYIEWGEQQEYKRGVQRGMKWPDGPWVKNRKPGWYALPESETHFSHLFFTQAYGDRHIHRYSPVALVADARLYFLSPEEKYIDILPAILNSSITAFLTELAGRVTLGDGVLELKVEDARDYLLIPDLRKFDNVNRQAILASFQPLLERPIGSVFDEVQQPDRQELDRAVLRAIGLDPEEWLSRIYEGLTTLVLERTQLGQMRSLSRRSRPKKAARRVAEDVVHDLLPEGPNRFPDAFLPPAIKAGSFREIQLPATTLVHVGSMMGKEELGTEDGQMIRVANIFEARYVLFAQANGHNVALLPDKPVEVSRAVNKYTQYLRDLRQRLFKTYYIRTLEQASSQRFVDDVWHKFNLPEIEG